MDFSADLVSQLSSKHLLKHPFYQLWTCGHLKIADLQTYARQYFHNVAAFPRYVSQTHANCENIEARQVLLENLIDEERGPKNHPELWLRFAEGIGVSREAVANEELLPETREFVDTFLRLCRSSYEEGLGALFAYEYQIPEVAASKIEGLKKFYNISDERTLEFFTVHLQADVWHSQACQKLMNELNDVQKAKAQKAAHEISEKLWNLLSGVYRQIAA